MKNGVEETSKRSSSDSLRIAKEKHAIKKLKSRTSQGTHQTDTHVSQSRKATSTKESHSSKESHGSKETHSSKQKRDVSSTSPKKSSEAKTVDSRSKAKERPSTSKGTHRTVNSKGSDVKTSSTNGLSQRPSKSIAAEKAEKQKVAASRNDRIAEEKSAKILPSKNRDKELIPKVRVNIAPMLCHEKTAQTTCVPILIRHYRRICLCDFL